MFETATIREHVGKGHVPERTYAKSVICFVDGQAVEAVVPEALAINLDRLLNLAGGTEIRLAEESERRQLLPGRDSSALPLGPWYSKTVFVDVTLAAEPEIVFCAATELDASAIRWCDFARTVRPIVGRFAAPARDRVPAYRLSYRE